jgi:aminomethyltransferase
MLVINAANTNKDLAWMRDHAAGRMTIVETSDETSLLAVQGPKSLAVLQKLTDANLAGLQYYHFTRGAIAGVEMIISRTGYTGELGFELYFPSDVKAGDRVWEAIFDAGKEFGIGPIGLGARDTLRLEMGYCLYGHDIDQSTNPLEAGLGWITKLDKPAVIGRSAIMDAKAAGLRRKLVGFAFDDRAFPRQGYPIHARGEQIGVVTSGTFSPTLDRGIGMGYVPRAFSTPGSAIDVVIRGRGIPARVVSLPFIKK